MTHPAAKGEDDKFVVEIPPSIVGLLTENIFDHFLYYLYTNKAKQLTTIADCMSILEAKLALDLDYTRHGSILKHCEHVIMVSTSESNCIDVLKRVWNLDLMELSPKLITFVCSNYTAFSLSQLQELPSSILAELFLTQSQNLSDKVKQEDD